MDDKFAEHTTAREIEEENLPKRKLRFSNVIIIQEY